MLKVWGAYRFSDALSVEATIGQVQGVFSGTEFWHVNLNVEPWSDRRLSPFFGIGLGQLQEHSRTPAWSARSSPRPTSPMRRSACATT